MTLGAGFNLTAGKFSTYQLTNPLWKAEQGYLFKGHDKQTS